MNEATRTALAGEDTVADEIAAAIPPLPEVDLFDCLVADELRRAREKHPPPFNSRHEALAVIREEYIEFEKEVFGQKPAPEDVLGELVQIAAMCRRAAEDLGLVKFGQ